MKRNLLTVLLLMQFLLTGCVFFHDSSDFKLFRDEQDITEISLVYVSLDNTGRKNIEIEETVSGDQLASVMQALRELPCMDPRYEPLDNRDGECFQIKYSDGSYQLLDMYCNEYYDKHSRLQQEQRLEFDETQFLALWNQGFWGGGAE